MELINEHNPTVLPALVEPKQLLALKEGSDGITSGGVSEAREVLRYVFLKSRSPDSAVFVLPANHTI